MSYHEQGERIYWEAIENRKAKKRGAINCMKMVAAVLLCSLFGHCFFVLMICTMITFGELTFDKILIAIMLDIAFVVHCGQKYYHLLEKLT